MKKKQNELSRGRRRLLAALGTGGIATALLPKRWNQPVLESVLLPAHAATSYGGSGTFTTVMSVAGDASPLLNFLVPKANARVVYNSYPVVCVRATDFQGDITVILESGDQYEGPSTGPIAIPFYNTVIPRTSGSSGPSAVTVSGEVKEINGQFAMVGTVNAGGSISSYTAPYNAAGSCNFAF